MGQRSQIFIRYDVNNKNGEHYKGLIARDFSWNFGERMISRARYIMGTIQSEFLKYKWCFGDKKYLEKLTRICEVNFDTKDIVFSSNIIEETAGYLGDNAVDFHELFAQDNNDGQLFIDVTDTGIKYCFMQFFNQGIPMDGEQYMKWDCERESHPNWHIPSEYMDKNTISYTEDNINQINELATLMTPKEIKTFIDDDYSYLYSVTRM